MSETQPTDTELGSERLQRPTFRGCVFCYSAEWAIYAGRTAYRTISQ